MTKKTSKCRAAILAATAIILAQTLTAQVTFTDDFARAEIGSDWTVDQGNWWIETDRLTSGNTSTDNVITFNQFDLGDSPSFTFESNLSIERSVAWAGIVFHVADASNNYMLRVRPDQSRVQFISWVNGSASVLANTQNLSTPFVVGDTYLVGVNSPTPGEFDLYIRDSGGATFFEASRTNTAHSGGRAGFFSASTGGNNVINLAADDFSLQVVPEPATVGLLAGVFALGGAFWWRRRKV